jgi:hypothetical protein
MITVMGGQVYRTVFRQQVNYGFDSFLALDWHFSVTPWHYYITFQKQSNQNYALIGKKPYVDHFGVNVFVAAVLDHFSA